MNCPTCGEVEHQTENGDDQAHCECQQIKPGDRVTVGPDAFDCSPAWEGQVVRYWRNGAWIVRELVHNTECAFNAGRLTKLPALNWAGHPVFVRDECDCECHR